MLKIKFYNPQQKYIDETDVFPRKDIAQRIQQANLIMEKSSSICGWTIYEEIGGCWFPYRLFNSNTRHQKIQFVS